MASLTLLPLGCSGDPKDAAGSPAALAPLGPDPIVLRVPLGGGVARAFRYPSLDSLIWRSGEAAPRVAGTLAFDEENGILAYVGEDGAPGWIDLRLGSVRRAAKARLGSLASSDGWSIFGVASDNALTRLTPSGDWSSPTVHRVRRLFPQPDGSLLYLTEHGGDRARLVRVRPPDRDLADSLVVPMPQRAATTLLGDRVYLAAQRDLISVSTETMRATRVMRADDEILALASSPSGDRVYVAARGEMAIDVLDRYRERIAATVRLRGYVTDLRMDPLGRFLLVRPLSGDSAWVVAVATNRVVGTVRTTWRVDLPTVAPDGRIVALRGEDVLFVDAVSGATRTTVAGGGNDVWAFLFWNGFRPRARGLDQPVVFQHEEAAPIAVAPLWVDPPPQAAPEPPPGAADTTARVATPPSAHEPARARDAWTVSFAAVLSEQRAREIAGDIRVDGRGPRVVVSRSEGTTIYRVVLGPYSSRIEAERAGRASGHSYWVFEGVP